MPHILNIQSSPRTSRSISIQVADAFLEAYRAAQPSATIDTLNVWEENLPEFDSEAIGAKYKGAASQPMDPPEAALWERIQALSARFHQADRIVLGVPMWNFAYPYKLKQLIDLACQRNLLFTFDGSVFGPALTIPRALVIYSQGQSYAPPSPTPAARFDHQTAYIDFWLRFIGVQQVQSITVANTWSDQEAASLEQGRREAVQLAPAF